MTRDAAERPHSFVRRAAVAGTVGLGAALFVLAAVYRDPARPEGLPALGLRPLLAGDAPPPATPTTLLAVVLGALAAATVLLTARAGRRAGFKEHLPAAALAVALFLAAPAWRGVVRADAAQHCDVAARPAIDAALGGLSGRLAAGLRLFVEAPVLAYGGDPRLDLPTGAEGLAPSTRIAAGAAVHLLLGAAFMMLAGVRRALAAFAASVAAALLQAVALPAFVPGAPLFAAAPLAALVPAFAFSFATAGAPVVRSAAAGAAAGLFVVAIWGAHAAAPRLATRLLALDLPPGGPTGGFDARAEEDPVRLVLAASDLPPFEGALAGLALDRAMELLAAGAPCLRPVEAEALHRNLIRTGRFPARKTSAAASTPRFRELAASVATELDRAAGLVAGSVVAGYREACAVLADGRLIPDLAELRALAPTDPGGTALVRRFAETAAPLADLAARAGDFAWSVALREAALDLSAADVQETPAAAEERARIAVLRVLDGDAARGRDDLRLWLPKTDRGRPTDAVRRGVLAAALAATGDAAGAFAEAKAAWNRLGPAWRDPTSGIVPDLHDYWLLAEAAVLRAELARSLDPALAAQAAADADAVVLPHASAAAPVLPALVLAARLKLGQGARDEARALLRAARAVPAATLRDRLDGAGGRIAWPRLRRDALRDLAALLDRPEDAVERAEVEAELARI